MYTRRMLHRICMCVIFVQYVPTHNLCLFFFFSDAGEYGVDLKFLCRKHAGESLCGIQREHILVRGHVLGQLITANSCVASTLVSPLTVDVQIPCCWC